jgi:hypothetical protein
MDYRHSVNMNPARNPNHYVTNVENAHRDEIRRWIQTDTKRGRPSTDNQLSQNHQTDEVGVYDKYITLDTFYKTPNSNYERGEFQWDLEAVTKEQPQLTLDTIENVIEIQIGSFHIPILPEVKYELISPPSAITRPDTLTLVHNNANGSSGPPLLISNSGFHGQYPYGLTSPSTTFVYPWVNNPYSQNPSSGLFTIYIQETGHQSYRGANGFHHNFEFVSEFGTSHNALLASPLSGSEWNKFTLSTPIRDVRHLTLIFRNPDQTMKFLPDCYNNVLISTDTSVAAGGPFIQIHIPGHQLMMGDRIIISKFNSTNRALDTYINRVEGHVVAGDPGLPPLTPRDPIVGDYIWTDPAIGVYNLVTPLPVLPKSANVYIVKRRMRIPIRLRQIVNRRTNYIQP